MPRPPAPKLPEPASIEVVEDLQKNRWGGRSERDGRRLGVTLTNWNEDYFYFDLWIESIDGSELVGPAYFHLHDSFSSEPYRQNKVEENDRLYCDEMLAYETFTVGAQVLTRAGTWTSLELDLEEIREIPRRFKPAPEVSQQEAGESRMRIANRNRPELNEPESRFERKIDGRNPDLDIAIFTRALSRIEKQVCKIKIDGESKGTGFLIGPDLVMTNFHVISDLENDPSGAGIVCEFDYKIVPAGDIAGQELVSLIRGHSKWLVKCSRYADNEGDFDAIPSDRLDFAVLRLATSVGEKRGWIVLPTHPPALNPDSGLIIVQHPNGNPLKLAIDTKSIQAVNQNRTRVRYVTNTEPGSSGSPCFNMQLEIVAIHHSGDPRPQPAFNQGIPIDKIAITLGDIIHP